MASTCHLVTQCKGKHSDLQQMLWDLLVSSRAAFFQSRSRTDQRKLSRPGWEIMQLGGRKKIVQEEEAFCQKVQLRRWRRIFTGANSWIYSEKLHSWTSEQQEKQRLALTGPGAGRNRVPAAPGPARRRGRTCCAEEVLLGESHLLSPVSCTSFSSFILRQQEHGSSFSRENMSGDLQYLKDLQGQEHLQRVWLSGDAKSGS